MTLAIILAGVAIISVIYVGWAVKKKRVLKGVQKKEIQKLWENMLKIEDPVRKIMEADAILDKALSRLGYLGTMGEKLKKAGPRFSNLQDIWDAHKLRNRLSHEPGSAVSFKDAERAVRVIERGIKGLM
ncbi:hypothetical protein KJ652_06240 [Patescibacteria group bacterium]|nr:hypothetical protein [Patescibacteria group bacterium]MBU1124151.1 hypothetical protein [Patescibacteria group bacterium]